MTVRGRISSSACAAPNACRALRVAMLGLVWLAAWPVHAAELPKRPAAAGASGLVATALDTAMRTRAACSPRKPSYSRKRPSRAILNALGVLRRPAGPEDVLPARIRPPGFSRIYELYIRRMRTHGGSAFLVVPARRERFLAPATAKCHRAALSIVRDLVAGRSPNARQRLVAQARSILAVRRRQGSRPQPDATMVFELREDGLLVGGGASTAATIRTRGHYGVSGDGKTSRVRYLVPDGVASVRFRFPSVGDQPEFMADAPVESNLAVLDLGRPGGQALAAEIEWLGADGALLRRITLNENRSAGGPR